MAPRKGLGTWRTNGKQAQSFKTAGGVVEKEQESINLMPKLEDECTLAPAHERFGQDVEKAMSENWEIVANKLPMAQTPSDQMKRNQLFMKWDVNMNGLISLAEIDKGIAQTDGLEKLHNCKPALIRAFNAAKGLMPGRPGSLDDDCVNKCEFRMLFVYLKLYFGFYQIFDILDTSLELNEHLHRNQG